MRFERDDAKLGLLVIGALAIFAVVGLQRAARLFFSGEAVRKVALADAAGMSAGTEVQLLGLRVGHVKTIEMERNGVEYRFVATLGLRHDLVLWRGTKAVVTARVMGGPYLELRLPPVEQRREPLPPGALIEGEAGASTETLVVELAALTRNLSSSVSELRQELKTRGLSSVLDQPQVRRTFQAIDTTLGSFDRASKTAESTFAHGRTTLEAVDRSMASLEKTLAVLEDLTRRRGPEMDAIIEVLGPALRQVQTAGADLSALLKDAGPEAEESLKALHRTLQSTQELVEILKAKPNRLVFGTPSEKERETARKRAEESAKSGAEAEPKK